MSNEPRAGTGLDPELLAAYIDQRLTPEQRAAVEAQLAADPDSFAVLVETMKAQDALHATAPRKLHVRGWLIAAASIAAAAVIGVLVWTSRADRTTPSFERLVAAAGDERYTEARLTGGFHFGPTRTIMRGSGESRQNVALLAVMAELERAAQRNPSAENLHAWGVAQVMNGDVDNAIRTLEKAASDSSARPEVLSDLSGAYLERAIRFNTPDDLTRALDFADRALAGSTRPLEGLFNRAIILSRLGRREEAIATWNDYLRADPSSPWSGIARRRLQEL